jgi:RHS repeat-associated protein
VTFNIGASDTLVSIAAGLASAMNGNANLQALGVTDKNSDAADLAFSQSFSGNGTVPSNASLANVSATDAVPTTKTNTNALTVTASASSTLTWDANGNMTSDGTNTYKWDAENRLIQIDYPAVNNFTSFSFDGYGRNTKIVETTSGSVTSTKQFVWCSDDDELYRSCEERDAAGALSKRFLSQGETDGATKYFYTRKQTGLDANKASMPIVPEAELIKAFLPSAVGSIAEMTDLSGAVQAQYKYDCFGAATKVQGLQESDFQYAGYYIHQRSGLLITLRRGYSVKLGRWISRDPLGEPALQPSREIMLLQSLLLKGEIDSKRYVVPVSLGLPQLTGSVSLFGQQTQSPRGVAASNLYSFVANDPINKRDPNGESWEIIAGILCVLALLGGICYVACSKKDTKGSAENARPTGPQYSQGKH